ncbi:SusC/RagA family TonB-linked outer membrane protein [Chryseosolibacter indicus]|uniref:SusC/RagA family TonB-linked outer membrane protein n=1 Tax=Chryseosolibacter indicus TaxID=2782351 RepID=A0ABS5VUJ7_9BACT|nr:SusC/RagA family TonB-linked outer membrane protein [Chryseosolibacter indicus]MBT1703666.1 SusC/RagA family TonB-linked outer membrane protein [Chryseosolibacter indicus]
MKNCYLLISVFLLILYQGTAQSPEVYASAHETWRTKEKHFGSNSLKESLEEVEKVFHISIAYKDEWVEGRKVNLDIASYKTVEDVLKALLQDTDLHYKKAGDSFYVITKAKAMTSLSDFQTTSASTLTSPNISFTSLTEAFDVLHGLEEDGNSNNYYSAITITGTVTDESGVAFPGVNIIVKGTSVGASTDTDGKYTIAVDNESAVLVFSFVGYASKEVVVGNRTVIDVALEPDVRSLGEIVVTALGIEKSTKSLGYATAKVNSDELAINRTPNVMNALQGKIAGVSISALGTGPGGTSKIRIRGQSSISGQNNPLIVVNGVPIDNTNFGTNPNNLGSDGSLGVRGGGGGNGNTSDGGDGLQSINPDDIESMTILKGAAAAALYGSRAKDGVIMITTKTKGESRGIGITYNMNYTNETPLDFTDYQYQYGQGENGVRPTTPNPTSGQWSFGEKFQPGMTQILFDGVEVPYVPQRNIIKKFFRHGQNLTNTITLSSGGDKGGFNLSLSNLDSKGIVPNNSFTRRTVNLGFEHKLSERLSFTGNINYSNEYNKNAPNVGQQDNTIPVSLYNLANSMPLWLLDAKKYNAQGNEYPYSRFMNRTNPYWTLAEQFQNIRRDRIFGNIAIKYDILPWLSVQGRIGQDYWSRDQDYNNFPTGQASRGPAPLGYVNGIYTQEQRRFREINADFLVTATRNFGDFGVNVNFGGNQMRRRSDLNSVQVTDFIVKDLYTVQNGRGKDPLYDRIERGVNSLYGSAEVSYKQFLFLTGTLRNDWFSTLSPANRSILYPSVTAAYAFTESFEAPSWLSFGKLRAAYAKVGSDTDVPPYSNVQFFGPNANLAPSPTGALLPLGAALSTTLYNPNLRPMTSEEVEVGLELKLFNNRVGVDIAAYNKLTTDQIVQAQISDASGYVDQRINSGKSRNRGIEAMVNLVPFETNNFTWEFTANGAYNITKVLSLITDTPGERITVGTHIFNGELRQVVGEEMGQLAGFGFRRDDQGRKIFGSNGLPLRTNDLVYFGSALPKWVGGFTNNFTYKGINLSVLIDFKLGGKMISGTNFNAVRHGLHKMTLEGREGGVIGQGVTVTGEPNTVAAPVQTYWEVVRSQQLIEPIVYNSGYWKLRQITLGYDFTRFLPQQFPIKSVRLSFVANNVLMLKKWVPNIDPESFGYSSDNLVGMESTGLPTTRSMGFNLNVKL